MADECDTIGAPVLVSTKDRRGSIMANTPGRFVVEPNPHAAPYPAPWYAMSGLQEVTQKQPGH
jgi:hypothetical protein